MPNWTSNTLEVCGKPEAVDKFVAHMGDLMDFEKVIPPPENMFRDNLSSEDKDRCEAAGIPTWRDWILRAGMFTRDTRVAAPSQN